ncbi:hypothetical protein [Streptomyces canus]|uniref:hypothetical protein n=1 Tax=Streptomyces canus TaxID=58343 RepID=UPI003F4B893D
MVPYADFNLLKFPDRDDAREKLRDPTMPSDIFPTGFHGVLSSGAGVGSTVYVAGADPVGLAAAASAQILGEPEVDAAVDAVGFETRAHGKDAPEAPATVLNSLVGITRVGGALGIPGLYVTDDPGGVDDDAKSGTLKVRLGLGWAKSHRFTGRSDI